MNSSPWLVLETDMIIVAEVDLEVVHEKEDTNPRGINDQPDPQMMTETGVLVVLHDLSHLHGLHIVHDIPGLVVQRDDVLFHGTRIRRKKTNEKEEDQGHGRFLVVRDHLGLHLRTIDITNGRRTNIVSVVAEVGRERSGRKRRRKRRCVSIHATMSFPCR